MIAHVPQALCKIEYENRFVESFIVTAAVVPVCFSPSQDLLRPLLCRECKRTDMFSVSVLKFWAQEWEDKLADLIYSFTVKSTNSTNTGTPTRKRHR